MARALRTTDEVFHAWAHQSRDDAKVSNVRFDGPVLFSYCEPIAMILPEGVLHHLRKWSVTTSSHQSAARGATRHRSTIWARYIPSYGMDANLVHAENRREFVKVIGQRLNELANHPRRKRSIMSAISAEVGHYNTYATAFNLDWPEPDLGAIADDMAKEAAAAEERARLAEIQREEDRRRRIEEQRENLVRWKNGEDVRNSFEETALRVKDDEIQTTHGARIPIEHAKKVWPLLASMFRHGRQYRRNGHTIHLGSFALDSFNLDGLGTLIAGCHTIPWSEIERMSVVLGLPCVADVAEVQMEDEVIA